MSARQTFRSCVKMLANIIRPGASRQAEETIISTDDREGLNSPKSDPIPPNAKTLLNHAKQEAEALLERGHSSRLEHCISLLHLAYTHLGVVNVGERPGAAREIAKALDRCHAVGTNDPEAAIKSVLPTSVVCSYPRSGNTVSTQLAAQVLQAQILEGMPGSMLPFSKKIYPKNYPYVRLVKDHVARPIYKHDRVAIVVRDGRDTMISLAYMSHKHGAHNFTKRGHLAAFIRWLDSDYPFGGWAKFMRDAAYLMKFEGKHVLRYEDLMEGPQPFVDLVRFLDPEHGVPESRLLAAYNNREVIFNNLKNNPNANRSWGIGAKFDPDSLFHEWSQNRKGSSWRQAWDAEAKKAFHETGATEFLIEYGYESDPDWWRQS